MRRPLKVVLSSVTCGVCSGYGTYGRWYIENFLLYVRPDKSEAVCPNCAVRYVWKSGASWHAA